MRWLAMALVGTFTMAGGAAAVCPGDCNGSGDVAVNELVVGVNLALGVFPSRNARGLTPTPTGR
jgi:hypothetical protein